MTTGKADLVEVNDGTAGEDWLSHGGRGAAGCRTQPAGRRRSPAEMPVGMVRGGGQGIDNP